jgi:hypothetical protein
MTACFPLYFCLPAIMLGRKSELDFRSEKQQRPTRNGAVRNTRRKKFDVIPRGQTNVKTRMAGFYCRSPRLQGK